MEGSCIANFSGPTLAERGGTGFGLRLKFVDGLDPGVVDIGRRKPRCGVGIRLGVVLPPPPGVLLPPLLGVGKRLRLPEKRLFLGSEYMFGEEVDIDRTPFSPREPLGGSEAPGLTFLAFGVFVSNLGEDWSRFCG